MNAIEGLVAAIKHVDELVNEDVLEPDLGRSDWMRLGARVRMAEDGLDAVLAGVDAAVEEIAEDDGAEVVGRRVAGLARSVAVLSYASGDTKSFSRRIAKAGELSPDAEVRAELSAASGDAPAFCRIEHARWLQRRGRFDDADRVLRRVRKDCTDPVLRRAAAKTADVPRPLEGAPPLFRLNGCGVALYGARDRQPDGWYVATYCVCLLFIPVLPLAAYWVYDAGDGSYHFRSKARLGPIARAWQLCAALGVVLAVGWGGVSSYLDSPGRRIALELEGARAAEAAGDRAGALERYADVVRAHADRGDIPHADLAPAAEGVIRLSVQGIAEPCTAASVDAIGRVVSAFDELPPASRSGAPAKLLTERLGAWADQIGSGTVAAAEASLGVLAMASRLGPGADATLEARAGRVRRALADLLAPEWPLDALSHYVALSDDADAQAAALRILDSFGEAPSLWVESQASIARWVSASTRSAALGADAKRIEAKLEAARAAHAADLVLIESGDEKRLAAALEASPGNQELAGAIAARQRDRGEARAAVATLTALGPAGRLTAAAQQLLGSCYAEAQEPAKAEQLLDGFVGRRLAAYQLARRAYVAAVDAARQRVLDEAKLGRAPADLERAMEAASEKDRPEVFRSWFADRIENDRELSALRAELFRHDAVVPASLSLGMLKLRRANEATGEERKALLAGAERLFLAIRQDAEGNPSLHLGLGQVYIRLGRTDDGHRELQQILDRKDPRLTLAVVAVYRELGDRARGRKIAEALHATPGVPTEMKNEAALLIAHIADGLDDEEAWLRRSDTSSVYVKDMLLGVDAKRALVEGRDADADGAFARQATFRAKDAAHDAVAANNTATAYQGRYAATGDVAHLRSSIKHLEAAARMAPDNAIVLENLSAVLEHAALVKLLEKWVQNRQLRLVRGEAETVLGALSHGPARAAVLEAMRSDPSLRRVRELAAQQQVLAPQKEAAYRPVIEWLSWMDDEKGLADMLRRIESLPPFTVGDQLEMRRELESGAKDETYRKELEPLLSRAAERVKRAEKGGHAPTLAAAHLLHAQALDRAFYLRGAADADLDAAIAAHERAGVGWPDADTTAELAGTLMIAAVHRARARAPALDELWKKESRVHSVAMMIHRAMAGPAGAEILAALRQQPELARAAGLRRSRIGSRMSSRDWILARLAGDAELEKLARPALDRPGAILEARIQARIYAGEPREQAELELFEGAGK